MAGYAGFRAVLGSFYQNRRFSFRLKAECEYQGVYQFYVIKTYG
jgi:hypothetical protein